MSCQKATWFLLPEIISLDMDFRFTILTDKSRRLIKHSRMKYISFMWIPGNRTIQNLEGLCTICIVKEQIKCTVLLLQKGVHELKETQKGIELMCHEMDWWKFMCNEITENYYRGAGLFRLALFPKLWDYSYRKFFENAYYNILSTTSHYFNKSRRVWT